MRCAWCSEPLTGSDTVVTLGQVFEDEVSQGVRATGHAHLSHFVMQEPG
jgi:hypothetical protein